VKVEIGASRAAVEKGFIERQHQVGQTGSTVKPRLYIAVGISGAVQHISGMQNANTIMAINNDPNAKIFNIADIALYANYKDVLPKLTERIKNWKDGMHGK
jgi:electron transfer flavoprotein alpha subunit